MDHQVLARRMREQAVAADLERIDVKHMADFLAFQVMGEEGARRFSQGAPLHTDDNALLEFAAPRFLVTKQAQWAFYDAIEQYREVDLSFLTGAEHEEGTLSAIKEETARFVEAKRHVMRARSHIARGKQEQAFAEVRSTRALNDVAWILATHPDPASRDVPQAIRLAEKACQLDGHKDATLMDTLSTTYASADRFSEALAIAKQALKLALAAGDLRLAEGLRSRIALYEQQLSARPPGPP